MTNMDIEQEVFELLKASIFTNEDLVLEDWEQVFLEMTKHTVASLPGDWLKTHLPEADNWRKFCILQQGNWMRIMYGQNQLISLLESYNIPSVIIKGAAAAMYYPFPYLRTMGDIDILVKREDIDKAAALMEENGFILTYDKDHVDHHYNYRKDGIDFELHRKIPVVDNDNEYLLSFFEKGIDCRELVETAGYKVPVFQTLLNGLVLIFHINQHLREGLGLRQIIDWMMYVNSLSDLQWIELYDLLDSVGMKKLAFTVTLMCQKYLGLRHVVDADKSLPVEQFKDYIMESGNFGIKERVIGGNATSFFYSATENGGFFRRLQSGGLGRWKAAQKHRILRPFAWIYQTIRIIGIMIKNHISLKEIISKKAKGDNERDLINALGLKTDNKI